jgi:DNA-binding XRE family transcriptional regulator
MTITNNSIKSESKSFIEQLKACLVTDQISLSQNLLSHWSKSDLKIKTRLADLIGDPDCGVYIIDTSIKDMDIWPAPFLTDPDSESKLWLFLISDLEDAYRFETLPAKAKFFNRNELKIEGLLDFVKKQLDPEFGKKIKEVQYLENMNSFVIHMENGKTYILKLSDLSEADSSKVNTWDLDKDHRYFKVVQESGNWLEVPWDDVLYHCEPEYNYYKGGNSAKAEQDSTLRIGKKIRQLRIAKGYSIEALAQKAGMKRPNLSRLESGKHQPSLDTLEHLAEALDVSVAKILVKP